MITKNRINGIIISVLIIMMSYFSFSSPAAAEIITVEVSGTIDTIENLGGYAFDGSVNYGTTMTGSCTYDTMTANLDPFGDGEYELISISMQVGNYTFTHDPSSWDYPLFAVFTADPTYTTGTFDTKFDGTILVNGEPKTYDDLVWYGSMMSLFYLYDGIGGHILDNSLPDVASWPDLSVFTEKRFETYLYNANGAIDIGGEINSLTVVPEPATFLLLSLGGLAILKKHKS